MLFSMGMHYLLFPYEKSKSSTQHMTALIHMTPLSLSVAYDESIYNSTYPEMQGLGRMDFIYEQ
jgi:hypothetical protein